jgi:hypothetical protein
MHKIFTCLECEAEFTLRYDMDDHHYMVEYCPFCGVELDDEEMFEIDDEDEE